MSCIVYIATKMTGVDTSTALQRAAAICRQLEQHRLTAISPVIEEGVLPMPNAVIHAPKTLLQDFWKRDKEIIISEAHVVLWDNAQLASFGCTREYCLSRGVLWKPTVILVPPDTNFGVAEWEDDAVFTDVDEAASYIEYMWGTRSKRIKWRLRMLNRTLPGWLYRQLLAFR